MKRAVLALALVLGLGAAPALARAGGCEDLAALRLEDGAVVSAETVRAGAFVPPGGRARAPTYDSGVPRYDYLPAFCRVTAAFAGELKVEVWLPAQGWTGEFVPISGGLYGGRITRHAQLAGALMTGAATATGNGGIESDGGPEYLRDRPEKLAALADAVHRTIVRSKAILRAYYGRGPSLTYMSDRAARDPLLLIQRWPEDLDAVAVTGAILAPTRHVIWQMWVHQATNRVPEAFIPPDKYPLLHAAVLKACDGKDGVADGVIEHPPSCAFDPGSLSCKDGPREDCLTAAQVEAVRKLYAPVRDARTGKVLFAGLAKGGELEWFEMAGPKPYPFADAFFRHLAFRDPAWDARTRPVDFGSDVDLADSPANRALNADEPDIRSFLARGGKLLLMAGWADQRIAPGSAMAYVDAVRALAGKSADKGVRFFLVPGMGHYPLSGQRASDYSINATALLKQWVRTGKAPDSFVAPHFVNGREARTRLVCAHPKVAAFTGSGSTDDPKSFRCVDR